MSNVIDIRTGESFVREEVLGEECALTPREINIRDLIVAIVSGPWEDSLRANTPMFHTMNITLDEVRKCLPDEFKDRIDVVGLFSILKLILEQKESIRKAIEIAEDQAIS